MLDKVAPQFEGREKEIGAAFRSLNKKLVRRRILTDQVRIDGRGLTDIRPLSAEVEVVPRAHGSALFERGETQILGVTTLNMLRMEQQIDQLGPETKKRYLHHYNFPPYSTGETGRVGSPKRREIGHGALAERALLPVLPTREEFPYAIRQVSEALGSNGSTSMGSVCASTMSLLNAGVPLKAPVAGIAMGLVSDEVDGATRYVALTDILGAEDAFGDMDFKVAGTAEFVTALQLDTKLDGIPSEVLAAALAQARDARLTILEVIGEAIDRPDEMSTYAPRVTAIKVPVDKIGEVIGPKGKMINSITEKTGADISIEDDGTIYVGAADGPSAEEAIGMINAIANPQLPKIGERFLGTVVKTAAFGAFVSLVPGKDGLVHISKLGNGKRIGKVEDVVKVGDKIRVEVTDIDNRGKISLVPVQEDTAPAAGPDAGRRPAEVPAPRSRPLDRCHHPGGGGSAISCPPPPAASPGRCCPAGCGCSPRRCRASARCRSGSGSASARATRRPAQAGAAHYLEHLLFKGTRRRTAAEIAEAFDAVGGELNAFTAKEHTCFYAHVLDTDLPMAVDVLADVVTDAVLEPAHVELERNVVLEEIAIRDDDPEDLLGELFDETLFGDHPLGRPDRRHRGLGAGDGPGRAARVLARAATPRRGWSSPPRATCTTSTSSTSSRRRWTAPRRRPGAAPSPRRCASGRPARARPAAGWRCCPTTASRRTS